MERDLSYRVRMRGKAWFFCLLLVLILQFVFSPTSSLTAAERQDGDAGSQPVSAADLDLPASAVSSPQIIDGFMDSLPGQTEESFDQIAISFVMPKERNLSELFGVSEISVLADVDGQYINHLAENQIMEAEYASQIDQANLLESINAGRSFNRESLAALARTEQAKAQTGQAFALLLPSVSVRLSSGNEKSEPSVVVDESTGKLAASDTHTRTDSALVVQQPLFNLPVFLDWRRRLVKEKAREESYRASDGDAYISTVEIYLSLVSSRLQIDIIRDLETQLAELLSYIKKRADAGAASVSDMSRVSARSQETMSSRLEQESAHLAAGVEFVRLTNLVPQKVRIPVLEDVGSSLIPESFTLAVNTAMQSNPEITTLTAELQAEEIFASSAKSRYLPRIDTEYTDTLSLHAGGDPSSNGQRDKRLMVVMNWDLFNSGRDYNYIVERKARYRELQYSLDDQRRGVVQALSSNYAALATTRARIVSGYQELESISTAAEAMSKRMLSGNQSLLDLLTVYDHYYQVRSRLVNLHILEMNTVAKLVRLTIGTPWAVSEDTSLEVEPDQLSPFYNDPFWDDFGMRNPKIGPTTSKLTSKNRWMFED
ncbi:MAG: TolC family protein [Proteobacteria bacterium]|nr:TolC family protein [Pseudomonadota bacterium]MBU1717007.1 TolC family protein [Pseudomonadota bacterium]